RFYLANSVDIQPRNSDGEVYFEVSMQDAWVWDMYRPARFVKNVRVMTFKDVNVEELEKPDLALPGDREPFGGEGGVPARRGGPPSPDAEQARPPGPGGPALGPEAERPGAGPARGPGGAGEAR